MERLIARRIEEMINYSWYPRTGEARRIQQQYGVPWSEALAEAGYFYVPDSVDTTPKYTEPTPEEIARQKEADIKRKEEYRMLCERQEEKARLAQIKSSYRKVGELFEATESPQQLLEFSEDQWEGMGVVDEEPEIQSIETPEGIKYHLGILMLRVPYTNHVTTHVEGVKYGLGGSGETRDTIDQTKTVVENISDFASVRIGIYSPYDPLGVDSGIKVQILKSNFVQRLETNDRFIAPKVPTRRFRTAFNIFSRETFLEQPTPIERMISEDGESYFWKLSGRRRRGDLSKPMILDSLINDAIEKNTVDIRELTGI